MVSIRIVRWSSPRPDTVHVSVESVSSTRSATFRSSSRYSRSRTWRDVTNFPSRAGERRVVDDEVHRDRRLFDGDALEPLGVLDVRHRQPDLDAIQARQRDDLAGRRLGHLDAIQSVEGEQPRDPRLVRLLVHVERQQRDDVADVRDASLDAANA